MSEKHLFVFGLGYSATAIARRRLGGHASVGGTVRSEAKAAALRAEGIDAVVYDGETPGSDVRRAVSRATHILQSIPPGEDGDPVLRHLGEDIAQAERLAWIGYLSTVGVYGDQAGGWAHETTMPNAVSARARRRVVAEGGWTRLGEARGIPVAILRIAGIYGPGRNAFVNLAAGTARRLVKPGQVFNRIHVDDIAAIVEAAASRRASGIFNLADDEPAPPQDVVAFAAGLAGYAPLPDIPFEEAELSPMARSFYADNKRIGNARLKRDLGVTLRYPNYRAALTDLWQSGRWRSDKA